MTHQEIAAEIEALNNETAAREKVIKAKHGAQIEVIREKCGTIGHIFIRAFSFSFFEGEKQDSYACAVCGARRAEKMKAAA